MVILTKGNLLLCKVLPFMVQKVIYYSVKGHLWAQHCPAAYGFHTDLCHLFIKIGVVCFGISEKNCNFAT